MSAATCISCGASSVILDHEDRCAGCRVRAMPVIPHPGYDLFLRTYPQTERNYGTGGNCTAWRLPLTGGGYLLITESDANQPSPTDEEIVVGRYFDDGDAFDDGDLVTWAEAIEYVRRAMAENTPLETATYFGGK